MPEWWQQRRAHGVAVWALCAPAGAAVPYHVDYAEQVRYATNIVAMPLVGGILHCTPSGSLEGGDYYVYLHDSPAQSLQHYQDHGYKSQRQALNTNNLQFKNTPKCNIESTEKRLKQHKLKGLSYTAKHWDLGAFIFVLSKKLINRWSHFSKRITN